MPRALYPLLFVCFLWSDQALRYGFSFTDDGNTSFRLYAPNADAVKLIIFDSYSDTRGSMYFMNRDSSHFSYTINGRLIGKYYGYQIFNRDADTQEFHQNTIIADPYSKAIVSQNYYAPVNKSLIYEDDFDWGDDTWVNIQHRDLIIYECHLKDMTAHRSSNTIGQGSYLDFIENGQLGGIEHLKDMGYNAVEFLPLTEFANVEIPYLDSTQSILNTWNPYEKNHWGYMPSFFFAPEASYASDASLKENDWNGYSGNQVREFKTLVKTLHDNDIAVIMDVVYNHISQYDHNPLKQLQRKDYFRFSDSGEYLSKSGCGNDLKTDNEFIRSMIVESVLYWMKEYHIDGFRFDLGHLIDWDTIELIKREAEKVNPRVFITCEPWGGGYDPNGFSDRGWSSWNDQFRNALKGWQPNSNVGYLFGKWHNDFDSLKIRRIFAGSPRQMGGQYIDVSQSLNYLESHDDYTLGDFIRIVTGKVDKDESVLSLNNHVLLSGLELQIHKIAAMALLTSQGPVMIAEGQEWARSKVIATTMVEDENINKMDHNSYEKDNETNWLNWKHKEINSELVDFYRLLIEERKKYPALRLAEFDDITFLDTYSEFGIAYHIHIKDEVEFIVLLNSDRINPFTVKLPEGIWRSVVNEGEISSVDLFRNYISMEPLSCTLLKNR